MDTFSSRIDTAEERISKCKDRSIHYTGIIPNHLPGLFHRDT